MLISGVNPWGFALHLHFLDWLQDPLLMNLTTEFRPPDFRHPASWPALAMLLGGMVLLSRGSRGTDAVLFAGVGGLSLFSARHAALFALLTAPALAVALSRWMRDLEAGPLSRLAEEVRASNTRLAVAERAHGGHIWFPASVALFAFLGANGRLPWASIAPELQPVAAADWLERNPDRCARVYDNFNWGAYLAWRLYPRQLMYVNSWHDHLGSEVISTWLSIRAGGPGWRDALADLRIDCAVVRPDAPIARLLAREADWQVVHRDDLSVVLVLEEPLSFR